MAETAAEERGELPDKSVTHPPRGISGNQAQGVAAYLA